jgi:glycosyltransferase involved in cell wall biosynthesis
VRILIFGHWSDTGFGRVTQELGARFLAAGHDPRVLAVNHRGEPIKGPMAGRVWPAGIAGDDYGGNISGDAIAGPFWQRFDPTDEWVPEVVLVVSDMSGMYGHLGRRGLTGWQSVPVFHYCPIEGDNLPVAWREVWETAHPVAMSSYGSRVIGTHIGRDVPLIYHGVDAEAFRPVLPHDPVYWKGKRLSSKEDCKAAFGLNPARLVILRTDRNVERKFYYRLFEAMVPIWRQIDDVDLVLHCSMVDAGQNLWEEIGRLPHEFLSRINLTNAHDTFKGLPQEGLRALYNAADLYVSTSGGEGFGLTLAESMACEVPVVITDWAADAETVGPGGVLIPPLIDRYGEPVRFHSRYGMDWAVPDPIGFVEPVVRLLRKSRERRELGRLGRLHVTRSFRWEEATASFLTLFEETRGIPDARRVEVASTHRGDG